MAASILGISGSPVHNSNTDRAIEEILLHSGMQYDFIKLSELHLEPCRACQGCISGDGACSINDNGRVLAEQFAKAKAFVLGGYTTYGSLDCRTKMFMERMFCLRHLTEKGRPKVGVTVITTTNEKESPEIARRQFDCWMQQEGIRSLGTLVVVGTVHCVQCGEGQCGGELRARPEVAFGTQEIQLEPTLLTKAAELGTLLREALQEPQREDTTQTLARF